MKKLFLIALFLLTASYAWANGTTVIYIADDLQGSNDGTSCANARPLSWFNTAGSWGGGTTDIDAGDTVVLCDDAGDFNSDGLTTYGSGSSGNEITITNESGQVITIDGNQTEVRVVNINNHDYITIDGSNGLDSVTGRGIVIKESDDTTASWDASSVFNNGGDNNTIQNVLLECALGRCLYVEDGSTYFTLLYSTLDTTEVSNAYENDLSYWGTGDNHTIKYCTFNERKTGGSYIDAIQTFGTNGPFTIAYNWLDNETGYDVTSGENMLLQLENGSSGNFFIYNNVFFNDDNEGQQVVVFDNDGGTIYFEYNTVVNLEGPIIDHIADADGVVIKNNILYSATEEYIIYTVHAVAAGNIDYNQNYSAGGSQDDEWYRSSARSWTEWTTSVYSYEANGAYGDPSFTNLSARNFTPLVGSPMRDSGDTPQAGFSDDYYGNARVGTFDIGAIEYIASSGTMTGGGSGSASGSVE